MSLSVASRKTSRPFLADVRNVPLWDRGVAEVRATSDAVTGVGFTFETVGHAGAHAADDERMAYELSSSPSLRR